MAHFEHKPIYDTPDVLIKSGQTAFMIIAFGMVAVWLWDFTTFQWLGWSRPQWLRWTGAGISLMGVAGLCSLIPLVRGAGNPWGPPKAPVKLLTRGLFALARHPGDMSILFVGIGWSLFMGSWLVVAGMVIWAVAVHFLCHVREERFFGSTFPDDWAAYSRRVKRYGLI